MQQMKITIRFESKGATPVLEFGLFARFFTFLTWDTKDILSENLQSGFDSTLYKTGYEYYSEQIVEKKISTPMISDQDYYYQFCEIKQNRAYQFSWGQIRSQILILFKSRVPSPNQNTSASQTENSGKEMDTEYKAAFTWKTSDFKVSSATK